MSNQNSKRKSTKEMKHKIVERAPLADGAVFSLQELLRKEIQADQDLNQARAGDLVKDEVTCEKYLRRGGPDVADAVSYTLRSLRWRQEYEVSDISVHNVSQEALQSGVLYFHGRSRGGAFVLIFRTALIRKPRDAEEGELCKRYLVLFIEEAVIRLNGNVTLILDCSKASKDNLCMDYVKFLIKLFKSCYPDCLDYVLVFDLPVVLHACWKFVSGLIPAEGIEKIKFVNKKSIAKYIDPENLPRSMGGTEDYVYKFDECSDRLPGFLISERRSQN